MQITRRAVLSAAVSMPVAMAAPRFALAEIAIGDATLTTVSDGHLIFRETLCSTQCQNKNYAQFCVNSNCLMNSYIGNATFLSVETVRI